MNTARNSTPPPNAIKPCRHLRTKKLYVPAYGQSALQPRQDMGASSHCWCNRTMMEIGADDGLVSLRKCADVQRSCYCP